jgi:hypothetical protein
MVARAGVAVVLVWAFRLGAQLGSEPPERGWVATATDAACEAARHGVAELARAYGTTIELGDCQEVSPDELRGDVGPDGGPPPGRPSNIRCLSRDSCEERF